MNHQIVLIFVIALYAMWSLPIISPGITFFVTFGQDGQGDGEGQGQSLVRCTAGNLVKSPSECPSTDVCPPPPPALGTVVNCTLEEPGKLSSREPLNMTERENLAISTDKPAYKKGEMVNITIMNNGTDPLTFPNSILGLTIENSVTHEKYPLFAAQVITTLDSGGSRSLNWNQIGPFGQQVEEGNYTASTLSGSITANTTFSVVK
jgi:hypothetical protein